MFQPTCSDIDYFEDYCYAICINMHICDANDLTLSFLCLLVQMIEYIGELVRPPISDIRERRIYNSLVVSFSSEFVSFWVLRIVNSQYEQQNFAVKLARLFI
jgi:hypothetical protein